MDGTEGETKFGWASEEYYDFSSKLNFAYLQTTYATEDIGKSWLAMLEKVIKDHLGIKCVVWGMKENAYIDHQSSASEDQNTEMFESEEKLKMFLFSKDSYIQTSNDNE